VQYEGEESERNVFYTGAAPNQQAIPAVDYLMKEEKVQRWVLEGTDYVYPRTTNKILEAYLKAKGVKPDEVTALILDRPRHADLIAGVRRAGAAVRLITDGDVAGVIHTADAANTGVDIYMGIGGAPEGVLAAAALRCIGGQMQCRLVLDTEEKRERAAKMGIRDPRKKYEISDMVKGDCLFAATGVTTGALLDGVRVRKDVFETETVVMRSITGTVRWISAEHRQLEKFHLG
jgi:fructose-1,6-bisphosphatase II / sedoheptulose-1,7-bisphosphatase